MLRPEGRALGNSKHLVGLPDAKNSSRPEDMTQTPSALSPAQVSSPSSSAVVNSLKVAVS